MVDTNDILIFDRTQLRANRARARSRIKEHSFLMEWSKEQILQNLSLVNKEFPLTLQLGNFDLGAHEKIGQLITMDDEGSTLQGDEEFFPFKENSFDLIISNLNLHSVNDLPGTLLQIRKALKPDGLFLGAMFGGETLYELRESLTQAELSLKGGASPRVFPFADKQQMGALLQRAGFSLPVIDSDIVTVTYENMFKLMHDLRGMGEGNIIRERSKINPGKVFFMEAAQRYQDNFAEEDGRIPASFEVIFLSGWSPHASQQQPLHPGSAEKRLSEALDSEEIKT